MKRRKFATWLGLGSIVSWLTTAIAACTNNNSPSTQATISPKTPTSSASSAPSPVRVGDFIKVGTVQELQKEGRLMLKEGQTSVMVMNNPTKPGSVYAIDSICTHQGCAVDWNGDKKQIVCPCHGSTFNADGTVIQGAATKPLKSYEAKLEGDTILVKIV
jgi:cytochrome b6-f complex iron-sulfur subunit